ncbi:MAG TPA: SDR family oxidoreductase [Mycobacteriales bacterium]|nr:SDR family oxidoreductase [Mycobacteriales bacterium]
MTVVTGAAGGIGRATVLALVARGAHVVAVDHNAAALGELAQQNPAIVAVTLDVRETTHAQTVVETALDRFGRLDNVVANAGVGWVGRFDMMPIDDIDRLIEVNLRAPVLLARAALPPLLHQRDGSLVFTTSIAGTVPVPTEAVYSMSKAALESFADSIREEVRGHGVVVSTVRPGVVRTNFLASRSVAYDRRWPKPVDPERIARAVIRVLETGAERRTEPPWLDLATQARRRVPWLYRPLARWFG